MTTAKPATTATAGWDSVGGDLAGPDIGSVSDCRIPDCLDQTAPFVGARRHYCPRHQRIFLALRILRNEGIGCVTCGQIPPDVELVSDFADALAAG